MTVEIKNLDLIKGIISGKRIKSVIGLYIFGDKNEKYIIYFILLNNYNIYC